MKLTKTFNYNFDAYENKHRLIINQGGTRSGKTYSVLQLLFLIVIHAKKPLIISVVSQTMPHLKKGAIRDFRNIVFSADILFDNYFNKTESEFNYNNCIIEFFSADNVGKVHGPARDILFINEANNVKFDIYQQLAQRTTGTIFLDFNPVTKFWVHSEIIERDRKHAYIHTTYLDNTQLSENIIKEIEGNKIYENWWRIYGLGQIGESELQMFSPYSLQYFESQPKDRLYCLAYIDPANKGKDYFACVIINIYKENDRYVFYVIDLIYNNNILINPNIDTLAEKVKEHNIDFITTETNGAGDIVGTIIRAQQRASVTGLHTTENKEGKIMREAANIKDRFRFKKDLISGSDYKLAMSHLTSYERGERNQTDDFPDVLAMASYNLRKKGFFL